LLLSLVSFAQEGTSSPYSYYGMEMLDLKEQLKIVLWQVRQSNKTSIHINLQNPASLTNLKITTFALGGTYIRHDIKTITRAKNATTNVRITLQLVFCKIGVGFFD
jgi:hypothetical protein